MLCSRGKGRNVKVGYMCGDHDGTVWVADGNRGTRNMFVGEWCQYGEEMHQKSAQFQVSPASHYIHLYLWIIFTIF